MSVFFKKISLLFIFLMLLVQSCAGPGAAKGSGKEDVQPEKEAPRVYDNRAIIKFTDGEMYFMVGDYARAILEYQGVAALDSLSWTIHMRLAESYLNLHKYEDALAHYRIASSLDPENIEFRNMAAQIALLIGDPAYAESEWIYLTEHHPDFQDAYFHLSDLYMQMNDTESANMALKKLLLTDPDNADALKMLVERYRESENLSDAIPLARHLVSVEPWNSQNYYSLVQLLLTAEKEDEAEALMKFWADQSEDPLEAKLFLANFYISSDRYLQAGEILDGLKDRWRENWWISHLKALVFEDMNLPDSVTAQYERAMSLENSGLLPYQSYALWCLENERFIDASSASGRGLLKDSTNIQLRVIRAGALMAMDSVYSALSDFEYLHRALPQDIEIMHQLAMVYDQLAMYENSDMLYNRLLDLDSEDDLALNNYSYSLAEREVDLAKALAMVDVAISLRPGNAAYLDTKAWILFRNGDYAGALELLDEALALIEKDAEMFYHRAEVLIALGRTDEALPLLRKVLELDPEYKAAEKRLEELIK